METSVIYHEQESLFFPPKFKIFTDNEDEKCSPSRKWL